MGDADFGELVRNLLILLSIFSSLILLLYFVLRKQNNTGNGRPSDIKRFLIISRITLTILIILKISTQKKAISMIFTLVGLSPVYMFLLILVQMIYKGSNKARFIYVISIIAVIVTSVYSLTWYTEYEINPYKLAILFTCYLLLSYSSIILFKKTSSTWFRR